MGFQEIQLLMLIIGRWEEPLETLSKLKQAQCLQIDE